MRPWTEIADRFAFYVGEYARSRMAHPAHTRASNTVFTQKQLQDWPVLTDNPYNPFIHIENLVDCLDQLYPAASPDKQLRMLHEVLNNLDVFFNNPATTTKDLTMLLGSRQKAFLKPVRYWKKKQQERAKKPLSQASAIASFTKSFSAVGPFHPAGETVVVRLDDLSHAYHTLHDRPDALKTKDQLQIGLFPLSTQYGVDFQVTQVLDPQRNEHGFRSDRLLHGQYKQELDTVLDTIRSHHLDIAVFPELVICDDSLDYLDQGIAALKKDFFVLVGGSFHRPAGNGQYKNTLPVYVYFGSVKKMYHYSKLEPFSMQVGPGGLPGQRIFNNAQPYFNSLQPGEQSQHLNLTEDIVPDPGILLLSSRRYGDIGFAICKDLLPSSSHLIDNYSRVADHLFVVSLNVSKQADFKQRGVKLKLEHHLGVYYVNARSFDPRDNSPSFVITPLHKKVTQIRPQERVLLYTLKARAPF